jgi:hypothetical protein
MPPKVDRFTKIRKGELHLENDDDRREAAFAESQASFADLRMRGHG